MINGSISNRCSTKFFVLSYSPNTKGLPVDANDRWLVISGSKQTFRNRPWLVVQFISINLEPLAILLWSPPVTEGTSLETPPPATEQTPHLNIFTNSCQLWGIIYNMLSKQHSEEAIKPKICNANTYHELADWMLPFFSDKQPEDWQA